MPGKVAAEAVVMDVDTTRKKPLYPPSTPPQKNCFVVAVAVMADTLISNSSLGDIKIVHNIKKGFLSII